MTAPPSTAAPVRVLRVIARLNVGGPAIQTINLTRRLEPLGFETVLLRGREAASEGSMDHLAVEAGVHPIRVLGLRREVGLHDLLALLGIAWRIWRFRPHILHSHTAKAGTLSRVAARLVPARRRPKVIVHTFHGHVFHGEFSTGVSKVIVAVERFLARSTTRLVAVSEEVASDLVSLRVAPREKVETVRLGFDLAPFCQSGPSREEIRRTKRTSLCVPGDALVVTVIARVVKIKRIDRFLEMATRLAGEHPNVWFVVAGDGDRRAVLERSAQARSLGKRLVWTGFQRDIPAVCFASDVVVLTSDNEGTPVCLIEAQAARLPVVTTRVGGVETVVLDGVTGRVVAADPALLAAAVGDLLKDPALRERYGVRGREHSLATFSMARLVGDISALYERLLCERVDAGWS